MTCEPVQDRGTQSLVGLEQSAAARKTECRCLVQEEACVVEEWSQVRSEILPCVTLLEKEFVLPLNAREK